MYVYTTFGTVPTKVTLQITCKQLDPLSSEHCELTTHDGFGNHSTYIRDMALVTDTLEVLLILDYLSLHYITVTTNLSLRSLRGRWHGLLMFWWARQGCITWWHLSRGCIRWGLWSIITHREQVHELMWGGGLGGGLFWADGISYK